jgi:hypothetical protein
LTLFSPLSRVSLKQHKLNMNTTILKPITPLVAAFLLTFVHAHAQTAPTAGDVASTPAFKAFEDSFIAAVNAKDRAKLTAVVHPASAAAMAANKAMADGFFNSRFAQTIPAEHKTTVTVLPADKPLPFSEMGFTYPVKPTHDFHIQFMGGPNQSLGSIGFIVFQDGKWLEVVPAPAKK